MLPAINTGATKLSLKNSTLAVERNLEVICKQWALIHHYLHDKE